MSYNYIKSISGDFPNAIVSTGLLKYQIDNDGAITTVLSSANTSGDVCTITFVAEPSSGEKTAIDALIALHTTALIAIWNDTCSSCGPLVLTTAERNALFSVPSGTMIWNSTIGGLQEWNGSSWNSSALVIVDKTATFTPSPDENVYHCDASGAEISVNLPASSEAISGHVWTVLRTSSGENEVVIYANGAETIQGLASYTLVSQWDSVELYSDGNNFFIR